MFDLELCETENNFFTKELKYTIKSIFGDNIDAIIHKGYFIVPKDLNKKSFSLVDYNGFLHKIDLIELTEIKEPLLEINNLALYRYNKGFANNSNNFSVNNLSDKIIKYQKQIFTIQYSWMIEYSAYLKKFLVNRTVENKTLIQFDNIRYLWSELIEYLELIKISIDAICYVEMTDISTYAFESKLLTKQIRQSCDLMSKLVGGRGFLEFQAINSLWLFGLINKLYFF